jgi:hypothetical protein
MNVRVVPENIINLQMGDGKAQGRRLTGFHVVNFSEKFN